MFDVEPRHGGLSTDIDVCIYLKKLGFLVFCNFMTSFSLHVSVLSLCFYLAGSEKPGIKMGILVSIIIAMHYNYTCRILIRLLKMYTVTRNIAIDFNVSHIHYGKNINKFFSIKKH